jgi:hypothetical protein
MLARDPVGGGVIGGSRSVHCERAGSPFLEWGENDGFRARCGTCWTLGPEREEARDALRAHGATQPCQG